MAREGDREADAGRPAFGGPPPDTAGGFVPFDPSSWITAPGVTQPTEPEQAVPWSDAVPSSPSPARTPTAPPPGYPPPGYAPPGYPPPGGFGGFPSYPGYGMPPPGWHPQDATPTPPNRRRWLAIGLGALVVVVVLVVVIDAVVVRLDNAVDPVWFRRWRGDVGQTLGPGWTQVESLHPSTPERGGTTGCFSPAIGQGMKSNFLVVDRNALDRGGKWHSSLTLMGRMYGSPAEAEADMRRRDGSWADCDLLGTMRQELANGTADGAQILSAQLAPAPLRSDSLSFHDEITAHEDGTYLDEYDDLMVIRAGPAIVSSEISSYGDQWQAANQLSVLANAVVSLGRARGFAVPAAVTAAAAVPLTLSGGPDPCSLVFPSVFHDVSIGLSGTPRFTLAAGPRTDTPTCRVDGLEAKSPNGSGHGLPVIVTIRSGPFGVAWLHHPAPTGTGVYIDAERGLAFGSEGAWVEVKVTGVGPPTGSATRTEELNIAGIAAASAAVST
jgi:hypothetical protein